MNNVEKLNGMNDSLPNSNWMKSSHKSNRSFIQRKNEEQSNSFGIEMTSPTDENVTVEKFNWPKACCCCVSISTGSAGLKEKK